jgi:dihydrofolate reductase
VGKVVVNRAMSLDGFIAAPGDDMDFCGGRPIADLVDPEDLATVAGATGAMLVGRRTWDVGARIRAEQPEAVDYPFSGPVFVLTHRPLDPPDPEVTVLSGDVRTAVATALAAAGGKDLELLGADVARQCLQHGLVDEVLVYLLPVLLGGGVPMSAPGVAPTQLEPLTSTRSGEATLLRFRVRKD